MNVDILLKKEYNAIYKKIFPESENIMSWNLLKRERKWQRQERLPASTILMKEIAILARTALLEVIARNVRHTKRFPVVKKQGRT